MTPKEKALELSIKFCNPSDVFKPIGSKFNALKAVDEILENLDFELCDLNGDFFINPKIAYFKDVKNELELL